MCSRFLYFVALHFTSSWAHTFYSLFTTISILLVLCIFSSGIQSFWLLLLLLPASMTSLNSLLQFSFKSALFQPSDIVPFPHTKRISVNERWREREIVNMRNCLWLQPMQKVSSHCLHKMNTRTLASSTMKYNKIILLIVNEQHFILFVRLIVIYSSPGFALISVVLPFQVHCFLVRPCVLVCSLSLHSNVEMLLKVDQCRQISRKKEK